MAFTFPLPVFATKSRRTLLGGMIGLMFASTVNLASAKDLNIAFAIVPPYANDKTQSGFEVEVVKEALKYKGYNIKPIFASRSRVAFMLQAKEVDGASVGGAGVVDGKDAYYADRSVPYYDYAVTLKSRNLKLTKMDDLKDKSVIGFQTAKEIVGPEYFNAVKDNPNYKEYYDQRSQPLMLYSKRVDVTFGDGNIFNALANEVKDQVDTTQEVVYNDVSINPKNYQYSRPVFFDKKIRDDYNLGLKHLKETGRWKELFNKYKLLNNPIDKD